MSFRLIYETKPFVANELAFKDETPRVPGWGGFYGFSAEAALEFNFEVQHPADGGRLPPVF